MRIALLGELELRDDDGRLVEIAGVRLRRLLARLVIAGGRPRPGGRARRRGVGRRP
ncbi:hypothetical protein [Nonomuraea guangzhouensis]|uniref:Uncharacterized protein n=1 Tax=Nonomuraea guangzhouensis TaxID=1291555 RepID=A0ABW4G008_9ACTN|nr:hypothetical protein [Nonomuraea guangzhouensis]